MSGRIYRRVILMLIANTKGRVSTLAVDDNLDMNGRNVTNADVVSVNEHVTLVGARLPGKGFRHVERDGWSMSKDNGDVERKFWKDDFSVDSSSQYTGDVANFTWDTANKEIMFNTGNTHSSIRTAAPLSQTAYGSKISFSMKRNNIDGGYQGGIVIGRTASTFYTLYLVYYQGQTQLFLRRSYNPVDTVCHWGNRILANDTDYHKVDVIIDNQGLISGYIDGVKSTNIVQKVLLPRDCNLQPGIVRYTSITSKTIWIKDFSVSPTISYADDFSTDTTERYQAVTGTVAYDDANKRMNVTTATGANGKASGRLKSYKFCEGAQQFDVTLPDGDSGDFICLVTHSANGLMTDGIGVGLQSDGNGNWNLATLSGTTVTEGADSGLDDADVARIEIEKDITGAYWYYIYDANGTKPTTATGKLFTTLTEGYTGWYANGNSKIYAIDNISIRAESIVGRTNVEVTEPFWFRDEFGENSIGRYFNSAFTYDAANKRLLGNGIQSLLYLDKVKTTDTIVEMKWTPVQFGEAGLNRAFVVVGDQAQAPNLEPYKNGNRYVVFLRKESTMSTVYIVRVVADTAVNLCDFLNYAFDQGTTYNIKVDFDPARETEQIRVYIAIDGESYPATPTVVATDTTYTSGYPAIGYMNTDASGAIQYFDNLQISGTRVYNKPIHRGAMLETYHDGTEEVVGTTFIDDCQWDRSAEYIQANPTSFTFDTVNGVIVETETDDLRSDQLKIKTRFGSAHYHYKFTKIADAPLIGVFTFCDQRETSYTCPIDNPTPCPNAELYFVCVEFQSPNTLLRVNRRTVGGIAYLGRTEIPAISVGETHTIDILHNAESGNIRVFYDGILKINTTDTTYTSGYCGPTRIYSKSARTKFSEIQIIGLSADSTNGIAACIPPIGGGARYGMEEEVYFDIDNEVRYNESVVMATVKTLDPANEGVEMFFGNTTDSSKITTDGTDAEVISLEDTNYKDAVKDIVLNYDDRGDEIKVGVRKTEDNAATVYVETLAVVPKVEVI